MHHKTRVFSVFEAPDTITNLQVMAEHFKDPINNLERHTWQ